MNLKPKSIAQLLIVLAIALAFKYHYSVATVNDLRWILAPTTLIVELVTGTDFSFESHAGYMSSDNTFLIATSCSGVNFFIIAFLVLALGKLWRDRRMSCVYLPLTLIASYGATLVANTTRIVVAFYLRTQDYPVLGMSFDELHRVEGIVVYFGFLLLLFVLSERGYTSLLETISSRTKYLLAIYYAFTLGIPVIRGAYVETGFWHHAAVVIVVPLVLLVPFLLFRLVRQRQATLEQLP